MEPLPDLNVTVQPYLPDCLKGRLSDEFNSGEALEFNPASWSYYRSEVLPAAIAGSVFAFLALIAFIVMLVWISINFCRCCTCLCRRCKRRKTINVAPAASATDTPSAQFITEGSKAADAPSPMEMTSATTSPKDPENGVDAAVAAAAAATGKDGKIPAWLKFLRWFILLIGILLFACGIWAIVDSLKVTNDQIDKFWGLVETVDNGQAKIGSTLGELNQQVGVVKNATQQLNVEADKIQGVLNNFGSVGSTFSDIIGGLTNATADAAPVQEGISTAVDAIEQNVGETIGELKDKFKNPTLRFQNQGRIILIVVIIGMILLCCVLLTWLCWSVPMRHPIIASSVVAVMLFFIFIVLLFGSGVGKSMRTLSDDACMYAETYVAVTLLEQVKDPTKAKWLRKAVDFYIKPQDPNAPPPEAGSAVSEVLGVDLKPIKTVIQSGAVTKLLGLLDGNLVKIALNQVLEPATVEAIGDLSNVVQPLSNSIANLDELASRDRNHAIYKQTKSLVCCEGAHAVARLYICWTIVGGFAFLLSALCFWRIVSQVRENRRLAKAAAAGAGAGGLPGGNDGDEVIKPLATEAVEVAKDVASDVTAAIPDQATVAVPTDSTASAV